MSGKTYIEVYKYNIAFDGGMPDIIKLYFKYSYKAIS